MAYNYVTDLVKKIQGRNSLGMAANVLNQNLPGFVSDQQARGQQTSFLSPEQFSKLFAQMTQPAINSLNTQYNRGIGDLRARNTANFASRGQLFGGSLTGANARGEADLLEALMNQIGQITGSAGAQLGLRDIELGAGRQAQSQQLLAAILQQILQGQYGLRAAELSKPDQPTFSLGVPGIGGISF